MSDEWVFAVSLIAILLNVGVMVDRTMRNRREDSDARAREERRTQQRYRPACFGPTHWFSGEMERCDCGEMPRAWLGSPS